MTRAPSKLQLIFGWVITVLVFLMLTVVSASGKFAEWEGKEEMFGKFGFSLELMKAIGVLEVAIGILYLIPHTSVLGVILVTGYLGGATVTHLRIGDAWQFPVVLGVIAWIGIALRQPLLFRLLFKGTTESNQAPAE